MKYDLPITFVSVVLFFSDIVNVQIPSVLGFITVITYFLKKEFQVKFQLNSNLKVGYQLKFLSNNMLFCHSIYKSEKSAH